MSDLWPVEVDSCWDDSAVLITCGGGSVVVEKKQVRQLISLLRAHTYPDDWVEVGTIGEYKRAWLPTGPNPGPYPGEPADAPPP